MKIDVMLGGGLSILPPHHRARQNPTNPAAEPARHASITQPIGRPLPSCSALTAALARMPAPAPDHPACHFEDI